MPEAGELLPMRLVFALRTSTGERESALAAGMETLRAPLRGLSSSLVMCRKREGPDSRVLDCTVRASMEM